MLLKFLTKCVPLCTPNWTPERWFKRYHMNARKMKNPANQKISRVLLPLEKWFVGVAGSFPLPSIFSISIIYTINPCKDSPNRSLNAKRTVLKQIILSLCCHKDTTNIK